VITRKSVREKRRRQIEFETELEKKKIEETSTESQQNLKP
jgi:hypothetical protein